jgi:hypothetical protein
MIPIPAFNILALGLMLVTHRFIRGPMDPLFKTLYTASMSVQAFLLISAVCPVYFTDLLSSPPTISLFSGSEVIVYGTSITTNASGTQDPTWECFIDNTSIGWLLSSNATTFGEGSQNNWPLCEAQFQDGPHSLTVNANVSNQQTFWFDHIQYAPSASVSLNQSFLRIDSNDSAIQYSPAGGWSTIQVFNNIFEIEGFPMNEGNFTSTQITGANLTYLFSGS